MKITGIIAEYNPFHNGHAFFMKALRQNGADRIAVIMSGNFVQRGEAAVLSKWARARQALLCGADLVVELPLPWAVAGAERFSLGGTALVAALGADEIGFGSECGDLAKLEEARRALASPELHGAMRNALQNGATFAAARQQAVDTLFGNGTASLLREPNNILGVEYLKAIESLGAGLNPFTVKRSGAVHLDVTAQNESASSSAIRALMYAGRDFSPYVPEEALRVAQEEVRSGSAPASLSRLERGFLAVLRRMSREDFARLPDISEGLENRIYAAVRKAGSLNELTAAVKSKRYPLARIRRILLAAFLGIDASDAVGTPPYLHILGIGSGGKDILRAAEKKASLPIIAKHADLTGLDAKAKRIFSLEARASDLYALCMPRPAPCGLDSSSKLIVL